MLTLAALADGGALRHAFFTRAGGESGGLFASLNCGFGSGDDPAKVAANRAAAAARLGFAADRLVTCHQIHSAEIVTVARPWRSAEAPRADGLVSKTAGIALGILAADCAPLLFADPEAGVIGAAHGGWRGVRGGVVEAAVAGMAALGARPDRIRAGIGPCIARQSYEVGPEFPGHFTDADDCFEAAPRAGHFLFDLPRYIELRLARLGLAAVERLGCDTVADEARFFSYRRACLRGERDYGRLLAAIALAG